MKFRYSSRKFLVSTLGLFLATLLSACSSETINYVLVGHSTGVDVFAQDSSSGALRGQQSTQTAGGNIASVVSMAVATDYANLYVVNKPSSGAYTVVHANINDDGSLSYKDAITLPASAVPVAVAVNASTSYLYVAYQLSTQAVLAEYALNSGAIGSQIDSKTLGAYTVSAIAILPNSAAVYATAYNATNGFVFGYALGSGGALTAATGSPWSAGVKPVALLPELTSHYVYVADQTNNSLIAYKITNTSILSPLSTPTYVTGNLPTAMAIDPRGKFLYVANLLDATVSSYVLDLATGTPTTVSGSSNKTDTAPVAIVVDPAVGRFVMTANRDANDLSSFSLNTDNGVIAPTQSNPTNSGRTPTSILGIPHGNHAIQNVTN